MIDLLASLADVVQIAHDISIPHQEPSRESGGGASPVVILAGILATLAAVAGLVWLKKRADAAPADNTTQEDL